jgi:hypothetical protein
VPRDLAAAAAPLRAGHDAPVPPGMLDLPDTAPAFAAGPMARDPDGHALPLLEE